VDDDEIRKLCREYNFPLIELRTSGEVLMLTPESLAALPDSEALRALADELDEGEWKHVTFMPPDDEEAP
jgi:hypothetical protein